ncbi:MAG: hypothetical protein ACRENL_01055 [Candidatus Dormibacteria bacterium]
MPDGSPGFTAESVFLSYYYNSSNAMEVGFFSGQGAPGFYTNGIVPYYTYDNGVHEVDDAGEYLPANTGIALSISNPDGHTNHILVDNPLQVFWSTYFQYTLTRPVLGHMQGETNCHDNWMAGGQGYDFSMYWMGADRAWHPWSFMNNYPQCPYYSQYPCPYTYSQINNFVWFMAGYGSRQDDNGPNG